MAVFAALDVCQCAEWMRWIQKSRAMFSEACVFVVSEENTILANFTVHFGMKKNLPYKEDKIEEQTACVCSIQSLDGWFCVDFLVVFSLTRVHKNVQTSSVRSLHWTIDHISFSSNSTSVFADVCQILADADADAGFNRALMSSSVLFYDMMSTYLNDLCFKLKSSIRKAIIMPCHQIVLMDHCTHVMFMSVFLFNNNNIQRESTDTSCFDNCQS